MKFKLFSVILTFFLAVTAFSAFAEDDKSPLVFAGSDNFAPYSFYSDNEQVGFSVDLMQILSASMDRNVTIKLMSWDQCLAEIKSGKVQGLIGAPVNNEWDKFMDFSEPVSEMEFAIFVEAGNSYVNSLKSLEGTVVAVHRGSIINSKLKKDHRLTLLDTETVLDGLRKLKNREVTAVIAEKNVALYYIQSYKISDLKVVGQAIEVLPYAIGIQQNNPKLLSEVNKGVSRLTGNATLSNLQRKWLGLRLTGPFPWKMFLFATSGITLIFLFLASVLWVISLNATVQAKTRQIQLMSQKMIEKDKLAVLGKLAGQIAHELRTPLSIINNSVFLLKKEGNMDHELFEKRLRVLEDKIKLSSNILESILSYSRVKAEVASMVSVRDCVDEVLKDLQAPNTIRKNVTSEGEPLSVFMDFHQLYSVIRNLALNGVQAMGETGDLEIKIYPSDNGSTVNLLISDTGGGIEETTKNKLFSLFYSTKITGTGLGLPISRSIIEANGGTISLAESSGKGTSFIITLPSARMAAKK